MASPTARSSSRHAPLFESPSKYGEHHTFAAYIPTESRFQWQSGTSATDALYKLPTSVGTGSKKSFGTSTREDWDTTKKRANPCAGPGSYESPGSCAKQASSMCRSAGATAFDNAPRSALRSDATPSPGPIYALPDTISAGASASPKFGTSKRQPLNGKSEGPGPNIALKGTFKDVRPGVAPTFGTEHRLRAATTSSASAPGPIYDLSPTGFRTGGILSFTKAKRFQ